MEIFQLPVKKQVIMNPITDDINEITIQLFFI